jgi:cytochrome b6-f complex iron-sulfur subunit
MKKNPHHEPEETLPCSHSTENTPEQTPATASRREFLCGLAALSLLGYIWMRHRAAQRNRTRRHCSGGNCAEPSGRASHHLQHVFSAGGGKLTKGQALVFMMPGSGEPGVVLRNAAGELRALSAKCTHVGCTVAWQEKQSQLRCPCHSSNFDANGKVLGGPAKKDLQQFKVSAQGDDAIVTL